MVYRTAAVGFGAFFSIVALIVLLLAVATTSWVVIQVDPKNSNIANTPDQLAHLTRRRGLFLECFDELGIAKPLLENEKLKSENGDCINTDFTAEKKVKYSSDNKMRSDFMIVEVTFFMLSIVLIAFAFAVFCFSLCVDARSQPKRWSLAVKWAGILLFVAAFANALGMAFFHAAEYLEMQKITANDDEAPYPYFFRLAQSTALQEAYSRTYSWSYAMSWLAVFFEILAALTLFFSGVCCRPKSQSDKLYEASTMNSAHSYGHRNRAYEYVEGRTPMPPAIIQTAPAQVIQADGPMYYDHFRGPHFDPYSKRSGNQMEITPQYNYDDGGWRWN